jgi:two-component system, NarL family, sensor histidine kinase BarA
VSYRTFKHLLGETSLERKCRFIFGGGILALVTLSFWMYGRKTEALVVGRNQDAARWQVPPIVNNIHLKAAALMRPELAARAIERPAWDVTPRDGYQSFDSHIIRPFAEDPTLGPRDDFERLALERFLRAAERQDADSTTPPAKPFTFSDGTPTDYHEVRSGNKEYAYVQAILFRTDCLTNCHDGGPPHHAYRQSGDGKFVATKAGDLAGVVVVKLPMEKTQLELNSNRAILIATALVTAILAMIASWMIVRYVIVRPVKHLRDVSNAIAAGKLTIRSQIETGDEFEELSHAFNRMLHNLVTMQQELRDVNRDLDRKVDELAQANLALYEMNRLKSDFLATMSHELRTPLNSIIGFSEVLATNEQISEKQRRYAGNIQTSGRMLLNMINDILDLAKIESGKMEVRVEDFSIRDISEALVAQMRPLAERKNIDLSCRLDDAIPLLRQDATKVRQIVYNLLSNAVKFTPEGGRVVLSAKAQGRNLIIDVIDTGIGIAEEDRETIFEKFRQAGVPGRMGGVLTREHEGTGLGLSIVRELSRLLGGDIKLESEPGRGSTFTVTLPLQSAADRQFEVNLTDERIDLSKAKRIETRGPAVVGSSVGLPALSSASERRARVEGPKPRGNRRIDPGSAAS